MVLGEGRGVEALSKGNIGKAGQPPEITRAEWDKEKKPLPEGETGLQTIKGGASWGYYSMKTELITEKAIAEGGDRGPGSPGTGGI